VKYGVKLEAAGAPDQFGVQLWELPAQWRGVKCRVGWGTSDCVWPAALEQIRLGTEVLLSAPVPLTVDGDPVLDLDRLEITVQAGWGLRIYTHGQVQCVFLVLQTDEPERDFGPGLVKTTSKELEVDCDVCGATAGNMCVNECLGCGSSLCAKVAQLKTIGLCFCSGGSRERHDLGLSLRCKGCNCTWEECSERPKPCCPDCSSHVPE
jgi:hypothetical protein